jgi:hypothetical protein
MFVLGHSAHLSLSLKRQWGMCWLYEAGLFSVQCGPVVVEISFS